VSAANLTVQSAGSLAEALRLKSANTELQPLAGGTDLMVQGFKNKVLDIHRLDELRGIDITDSGELKIGALTTFRDIIDSELVQAWSSCLVEAARTVGARTIQNRATIGGNIGNASPAGDSLPLLMALDSKLVVASELRGEREIPFEYLFEKYRTLNMQPDELIVAVLIPEVTSNDHTHYRKVGARSAQAISKVCLSGRVRIEEGVVTEARIAYGAVGPVPLRCPSVEEALVGSPVDPQVSRLVLGDITPMDDIRSTAEYRNRVAVNVLRAWLEYLAR
jgi:xanthine dehydrogenase small subunit